MATLADTRRPGRRLRPGDRFFLVSGIAMAAIIFVGFTVQVALGRSTFAVPPLYHLHALVFMGWVVLYLAQTWLATLGPMAWHRPLGWIAAAWLVPMAVLGPALTIDRVQSGRVPFFFEPQHFLFANPMTMVVFIGLTIAAIIERRRTDWHRRLHLCGMASLLGPGLGRLLPLPFMEPFAFQASTLAGLAFPIAGMVADKRRSGRVHAAWWWGVAAILAAVVVTEGLARSPVGDAIYAATVAGTPGEGVAPMDFVPRPPGFPPRP